MSGGPRSLPSRPSLRYLKLEAKHRRAAGEFPTLHDAQVAIAREHGLPSWTVLKQLICGQPQQESHALAQLRWIITRFRDAGAPGWTAPGEHEMRQHFDDHFLTAIPAGELIAMITSVAADLRGEIVVISQAPLGTQVWIASLEVFASAAAEPPHRLTGLQAVPRPGRSPTPALPHRRHRTLGDVPADVAAIADEAFAELGLAALVLAGGGPDTPPWVVAKGWPDLGRTEALGLPGDPGPPGAAGTGSSTPVTGSRRSASPRSSPPPPCCGSSPTAVSLSIAPPTATCARCASPTTPSPSGTCSATPAGSAIPAPPRCSPTASLSW